jgi:hypothetical protein
MFIGRTLFILGLIVVFFSSIVLIIGLFTNEELLNPFFALLNGFIAMGVGDLVIDANHRKRLTNKKTSS